MCPGHCGQELHAATLATFPPQMPQQPPSAHATFTTQGVYKCCGAGTHKDPASPTQAVDLVDCITVGDVSKYVEQTKALNVIGCMNL